EDIMQAGISDDAARVLTLYVASSGNIERIGDYGKKLLEYYAYRQNRPKDFSPQAMTELSGMYAEAHHAIVTALDGFINDDPDKAREVAPIAGKLRGLEVELRNRHIQRLDKQECDSETGLVYVDILGIIEHIGYHSNNVAKATISTCAETKA
ncbi:PhoU domain-containing protein, partial [Bilophila sp.]